jgi:hypothetical protein
MQAGQPVGCSYVEIVSLLQGIRNHGATEKRVALPRKSGNSVRATLVAGNPLKAKNRNTTEPQSHRDKRK